MKRFFNRKRKIKREFEQIQEQKKGQTIFISYRTYLNDHQGKGLFDYREDYLSENFVSGVYELELDTYFFFYRHQSGNILISKTMCPNNENKEKKLILWVKVNEVKVDKDQFYEIELKKPSELREEIERKNFKLRSQLCLFGNYTYGEKFKPVYQQQEKIAQTLPKTVDEDICMVIKTFDEYELKKGSIVKFAFANNKLDEEYPQKFKYRYNLHFQIESIQITPEIQEVNVSEIKNNTGLHIKNQKFEIFCVQKSNELGKICPYCTNQENESLQTTLVNFCQCKNDNVYCLRCLCEINQLQIQKNDYGQVKIKLSIEMICKTCKDTVPQYICITKYDQITKQRHRHYFETISKQKKSKIILKNLKTGQQFKKELNEGEMQIGKNYGCWICFEDRECLDENQASVFFKRATQKIHIKDNRSRYGTFVVEEKPTLLLNKKCEQMSKSIQIGSSVISFRLNL